MTLRSTLPLAVLFLAAGCTPVEDKEEPAPPPAEEAADEAPVTMADPPAPGARPTAVRMVEENDLFDFEASWPVEAAAEPLLDARFREQAVASKAEIRRMAEDEKKMRDENGLVFHGLSTSTVWTTAGQSERLLSLSGEASSYTGGAHPNYGAVSILWDREQDKEVTMRALFGRNASLDGALREEFCRKLDAERDNRRGGVEIDGTFGECPDISSDIVVVPTDADGNGKFERLMLIASPYVAGSYAEGSYEIVLPMTQARLAAVNEMYRPSFEAMR